jgi:hypothetical protein
MYRDEYEVMAELNDALVDAGLAKDKVEKVVDLLKELVDKMCDDAVDRATRSGRYSPDY